MVFLDGFAFLAKQIVCMFAGMMINANEKKKKRVYHASI